MQNNKKVEYDKAEIYEKEIAPLVHQLVEACNFNRIPLFVSAAVTNKDGKTNYRTETLSAAQFNMSLADDKVAYYINILNGFRTYFNGDGVSENEEYNEVEELLKQSESMSRSTTEQ